MRGISVKDLVPEWIRMRAMWAQQLESLKASPYHQVLPLATVQGWIDEIDPLIERYRPRP